MTGWAPATGGRYPAAVSSTHSRRPRRLLRTATVAAVATAVLLAVAAPATATPENWPAADSVDLLGAILLLGGVPLAVFVLIGLAVYAPSVARGESLSFGPPEPKSQWLGGPRRSPEELAAPDDQESVAGGAGGTW